MSACRGVRDAVNVDQQRHTLSEGLPIRGTTRLLGVLGDPIAHSCSPAMQNAALRALELDWCYVPLHVRPPDLPAALRGLITMNFIGANVTIPHKEQVAQLADELSPTAQAAGAVNTLVVQDGRLWGDNTDVGGILMALAEVQVELAGRRAVILGAGGSARAAAYALAQAGASVSVANRTGERAESLVAALKPWVGDRLEAIALTDTAALRERLRGAAVLINTTSVGMHPGPDVSPLPEGIRLDADVAVLDLVYAPRQTRLLRDAAAWGCRTIEGLRVLIFQGALSLERWTGRPAPIEIMARAAES